MAENKTLFQPDLWLSKLLGKRVFSLGQGGQGPNLRQALEAYAQGDPYFCYTKVPANAPRQWADLAAAGFHLADTNLVFLKSISSSFSELKPELRCRLAETGDEGDVLEIAEHCFIHSRFHTDPHFSPQLGNRIKRQWVAEYFAGNRGHELMVAVENHRILGFVLLIKKEKKWVVDLIGVDSHSKGRGIGSALLTAVEKKMEPGSELQAGTQLANADSIHFYQANKFKLIGASYVFHHHGFVPI